MSASVTKVDEENKQIIIAGGVITGIVAGDKIVQSGLSGANPVGIFGLPYHHNSASTGTWLGLDRSTYPEIRANRITASGSLALSHPRRALNKIGERLGLENGPQAEGVDASVPEPGLRGARPARDAHQQDGNGQREDGPLLRRPAARRRPRSQALQLGQDPHRLRRRTRSGVAPR
jgi:hypothetical protein